MPTVVVLMNPTEVNEGLALQKGWASSSPLKIFLQQLDSESLILRDAKYVCLVQKSIFNECLKLSV